MPDYSFIPEFDRTQLYEHFFLTDESSLAVISPPVDTAGFGAAFPYFLRHQPVGNKRILREDLTSGKRGHAQMVR